MNKNKNNWKVKYPNTPSKFVQCPFVKVCIFQNPSTFLFQTVKRRRRIHMKKYYSPLLQEIRSPS
jgi:hypothetical protein